MVVAVSVVAVVVAVVAVVVVAVIAVVVAVVAAAGLAACYCNGLRLCCVNVNYTVSDVLVAFASNIYYKLIAILLLCNCYLYCICASILKLCVIYTAICLFICEKIYIDIFIRSYM